MLLTRKELNVGCMDESGSCMDKKEMSVCNNHQHYYKNVAHLEKVDVYRVLELFEVTNPCIQHAVKKLLVAGGRGAGKSISKDIQEAIDSLKRMQEMNEEDSRLLPN